MNNQTHEAIDKIRSAVLNLSHLQNLPCDTDHSAEWKDGEVKRFFEEIRREAEGVLGTRNSAYTFHEEKTGRVL